MSFYGSAKKNIFNNSLASVGTLPAGAVMKIFRCCAFHPHHVHDLLADLPWAGFSLEKAPVFLHFSAFQFVSA